MPFRLEEHTADLALEIRAGDLDELFAEALRGLTDCLTAVASVEPVHETPIALEADDLEELLVEWLGEAVYFFDAADLIFGEARVKIVRTGGKWRLQAVARGEKYDSERHEARVPIKGVTYHGLQVEQDETGWRATVVLDI